MKLTKSICSLIVGSIFISQGVFAGVNRSQEADSFISSDHTKTWSLPSATDPLVGQTENITLSNKSMSGSANTFTNLPLDSAVTGTLPILNGGTNATTATTALVNLGGETIFNGFTNNALVTLSYVASTRTLSVIYSSATTVSVGGVYYTQALGTQTITHTATNGLWYFYYNSSGVLTASQTVWNLLTTAPVATVYYNSSNAGGSAAGLLSYECHAGDLGMSPAAHLNLHSTRGTQVLSGITASGYTLAASGLANTSYALSSGSVADEDLVLSTAAQAQGDSNTYRILYQTGTTASPIWNWVDSATGGIYTNGTNIYYNQLTGGNWQLTANAAGGNTYQNYWVVATTANSSPQVIVVMGSATYGTQALANAATFSTEVPNIGLLTAEGVVVYQMTYNHNNTYGAPGNIRLVSVTRVTQSIVTISTGSGTVTSVGLADDTGLFNITGSPVNTSGTLVLSSLQSQAANTVLAAPVGSSGTPTFRLPTIGATQVQDLFYGNGSTTIFTLSFNPTASVAVLCYMDGMALIQGASNDYIVTIAGPTVTINTAPGVGQSILCNYNKY